ncbi:hypothetical protein HPP92_001645 [Vanilla planifolia]|uniref:Uncharacterized protein n=1 Tax=Vanilla planifolia TaxID=51239 RepID=A0A835SD50_VANPL|nr:hypothetical protein HPP92_001645 [Vanilla planifolia]
MDSEHLWNRIRVQSGLPRAKTAENTFPALAAPSPPSDRRLRAVRRSRRPEQTGFTDEQTSAQVPPGSPPTRTNLPGSDPPTRARWSHTGTEKEQVYGGINAGNVDDIDLACGNGLPNPGQGTSRTPPAVLGFDTPEDSAGEVRPGSRASWRAK